MPVDRVDISIRWALQPPLPDCKAGLPGRGRSGRLERIVKALRGRHVRLRVDVDRSWAWRQ